MTIRTLLMAVVALAGAGLVQAQKTEADLLRIFTFTDFSADTMLDENGSLAPWFFAADNRLYSITPDKQEYRIYDQQFRLIKKVATPGTVFGGASGYQTYDDDMVYYKDGTFYSLMMNGKIYPFTRGDSDPTDISGFPVGNLLVDWADDGVMAYIMPEDPKGKIGVIPSAQFVAQLNAGKYAALGLNYVSGRLLFHGLPLIVRDMEAMFGTKFNKGYFGWDKDWNYVCYHAVYDRNGRLLQTFEYLEYVERYWEYGEGNPMPKTYRRNFYDHEGNFYTFSGTELYYIGRDWGYKNPQAGTVNDDRVRLRLHPSVDDLILGQADKGTALTIFEATPETQTIGGMTAPWYKVKLPSGLTGWMFGAFIDIAK
jgi:hypothetical protein